MNLELKATPSPDDIEKGINTDQPNGVNPSEEANINVNANPEDGKKDEIILEDDPDKELKKKSNV